MWALSKVHVLSKHVAPAALSRVPLTLEPKEWVAVL